MGAAQASSITLSPRRDASKNSMVSTGSKRSSNGRMMNTISSPHIGKYLI